MNPDKKKCPDCEAGYSPAYTFVRNGILDLIYGAGNKTPAYAVKITTYLCGREPRDFGHDSLDMHHAVMRLGAKAGLRKGWHRCKTCNGQGEIDA